MVKHIFFYYLISIKNLKAFVPFLMLHHFSGIIYFILFALHSLTCHLEETSNLIHSTKPFPLRLFFPIRNPLWLLTVLCTPAIISGQVGFKPQFTVGEGGGGFSNLQIKNFYYYCYISIIIVMYNTVFMHVNWLKMLAFIEKIIIG